MGLPGMVLRLLILFAMGLTTACNHQRSVSVAPSADAVDDPAPPVDVPFETSFIAAAPSPARLQAQPGPTSPADGPGQDIQEDVAGKRAQITAQDPKAHVNVRSLPAYTAEPIGHGLVGDTVQLGRSEISEDGHTWHHVTFVETPIVGWIRSDFLDVQAIPPDKTDAALAGNRESSTADPAQDALKAALDKQCGNPDAIRAYFVTQQHTIYLCEVRRKLWYLSQEHGTQQVIVVDTVQAAGGGYLIQNSNYEYRLDASGFVIVRIDAAGKEHPILEEPIVYSERYGQRQSD